MKKMIINTGNKSYPINIKHGLLNDFNAFWPLKSGDFVMLVTNKKVANIYLDRIYNLLKKSNVKVDYIILPDGEIFKNLLTVEKICTELLEKIHGRDTTLIALGGGVIGDVTGFVASIYQRGVRFIQVPTTLLSQVDASIGGKTGVNHILGKNMIGSFYQPSSVIIDPSVLTTLDYRELSSGMAEVIKYGIVFDKNFFSWIESNIDFLLKLDIESIISCIYTCCKIKTSIVSQDEHEHNLRSILNFGHTYGHAIESHTGYGNWLHGEAISVGMIMAAYTGKYLKVFKDEDIKRIVNLLTHAKLPTKGPDDMLPDDYIKHMMHDKKVLSGKLRLIFPLKIGRVMCDFVSSDIIKKSIQYCS